MTNDEKDFIKENWINNKLDEDWDTSVSLEFIRNNVEKDNPVLVYMEEALSQMENSEFCVHSKRLNQKLLEVFEESFFYNIVERYGGDTYELIHGSDDTKLFKPHVDPPVKRNCGLTFPIFPDKENYRSTFFYEPGNTITPVETINYAEYNGPMLLNTREIHACGLSKTKTQSLAFQVSFFDEYEEVIERFNKEGLLTTAI